MWRVTDWVSSRQGGQYPAPRPGNDAVLLNCLQARWGPGLSQTLVALYEPAPAANILYIKMIICYY